MPASSIRSDQSALWAKKKRRRRKNPPTAPTEPTSTLPDPVPAAQDPIEVEQAVEEMPSEEVEEEEEVDVSTIVDVANFKFDGEITKPGR